jgi:hypothetical protein
MTGSDEQRTTNEPHRSFIPSDFGMRDVPFMLLAFITICAASVVLGLFVESLSSFWRGYLWGIATTILALAILRQISSGWSTATESDVEKD